MSATTDYESEALQDYRSASSTNVIESLLGSKLAGNMSTHGRDTAVICSVSQLGPEPDSTDSTEETNILRVQSKFNKSNNILCKETLFPIPNVSDKGCEPKVSVETLSEVTTLQEGSVKDSTRLYPVLPETEISNDSYNNVTRQNTTTILQSDMDSAIVQNITKLPTNFTLNVDGNIATIQNVTQSVTANTNQTLWLPTILATKVDSENVDSDRPQTTLSQIIITGDNYLPHNTQNVIKRTNVITETSLQRHKSAKVQIISNITIPKPTYGHQGYLSPNSKEAEYAPQNHLFKLSASVTSIAQKHTPNNSILNNKPSKTQSLITSPNLASLHPMQSQLKTSSSYTSNFTHKSVNRSLNKVNNGANVSNNMMVSTSSPCHVLSRVVPGPKLHTARKNSLSGGKTSVKGDGRANANSTVLAAQKGQSSRSIKIIQQTPINSPHKVECKSWELAHANVSSSKAATVSVIESTGRVLAGPPQNSTVQAKTAHNVVSLQRMSNKADQQQRIVLHSSCGQVIIPNSSTNTYQKATTQYNVQAGQHGTMRYVQSYVASDSNQLSNVTQISANQHLTAQILQSLSQPKLVFQPAPAPAPLLNLPPSPKETILENEEVISVDNKVPVQTRQVHGDPSTMHMADDIVGTEERPTLSEDALYPYCALQLVMLDHTYAVSAQGMATISSSTQPVSQGGQILNTCTVLSPPPTVCPPSPAKLLASPPSVALVTSSCQTFSDVTARSLHTTYTTHAPLAPHTPHTHPSPLTLHTPPSTVSLQPTNLLYHSTLAKATNDDDTASVASSVEEQHQQGNATGGSDTETAPEGEEDGKTRCVCEFTHDDGYMICCDRCSEWQHVDCMGIDRQNIPETYMCERCQPRPIDRRRARLIQLRKREELSALAPSDSDSSEGLHHPLGHRRRLLTVTTYSNSSGPKPPGFVQPPLQTPVTPLPSLTLSLPPAKRGPKRPRRNDVVRKGTKRKHPEKRPKRKKDLMLNRSKYSASMQSQVHNWNDSYELAVTNHYSPELRAKIARYSNKLGNIPNMACTVTTHYCTTVPHAGGKILIATKDLKENTAVIELRGKYMLSTQHRSQLQVPSRSSAQKPGPFLFFYRLPRDNTQICIDTRTYGNEARFVRRSCKPNAELQHCIVKGALHVYLVTVGPIQSNTEIAIGHDINAGKQPCACGNAKYCKMNGVSTAGMRKMLHTDYPREKRPRQRRSSSSSQASPTHGPAHKDITPLQYFSPKIEKTSPIKTEIPFLNSPLRYEDKFTDLKIEPKIDSKVEQELVLIKQQCPKEMLDLPDNIVKVESTAELIEDELTPVFPETPKESQDIKHELKMEDLAEIPIPPVYEKEVEEPVAIEVKQEVISDEKIDLKKCEPVEAIKHEPLVVKLIEVEAQLPDDSDVKNLELEDTCKTRVSPEPTDDKQLSESKHIDEDKPLRQAVTRQTCHLARGTSKPTPGNDSADDKMDDDEKNTENTLSKKDKKKMTREERKMEAIMKAFERMEKAEQRKQEVRERQTRRRESDPVQPSAGEQDPDEELTHSQAKKRRKRKGRARTISQNTWSNSRRLNSVDSDMVTSGDENTMTSPTPPHQHEPTHHILDSVRSEDVNLSSACLLVEAAVGPLESAFKLPKTKKSIVSEWLGKSSESPSSPDARQSASYDCTADDARPYPPPKSSLLTPRSLQSLVRVASTLIGDLSGGTITADSSPEKNYFSGHSETDNSTPWASPDKGLAKSPAYESPMQSPIRTTIKRSPRNITIESPPRAIEKPKLPKKMKRGLRSVVEDRFTATRRTLRSSGPTTAEAVESSTAIEGVDLVDNVEPSQIVKPAISVEPVESVEPVVRVTWSPAPPPAVFQPPQHSAKKRWLRQAISEESDSPTAESPPSEMVTPLKKRRLARESLNKEPSLLSSPFDDRTWSTTAQVDSPLQSQQQALDADSVTRVRNFKSDFSESIYEDYRGEHTDSNDHSMECGYLDINLRNAHDTHKLKLDIHRIIGVPAPEDNPYTENKAQEESHSVEPEQTAIVVQAKQEKEYSMSQAAKDDLSLQEKSSEIESNFQDNNNSEENEQDKKSEISKRKQDSDVALLKQIDTLTEMDKVPSEKLKTDGEKENVEDMNVINKCKDKSNKSESIEEVGITYLDIPLPQSDNTESKSEPSSNTHSTGTSSSSSPMQSEMDDIQKKIHSFHTENIQILKIRNKKPPKSPQRKKVNLNFDLYVTDDQTVGVTLRTEKKQDETAPLEINGEIEDLSKKESDCLNVSTLSLELPIDEEEAEVKTEPEKELDIHQTTSIEKNKIESSKTVSNFSFSSRFPTTSGLFSGLFPLSKPIMDETPLLSNVLPDMNIIKSAIDKTANMETCPYLDRTARTSVDELRNVQEILSRVNRMDSNNSVLLSGVLRESDQINIENASLPSFSPAKLRAPPLADPRLIPTPVEKPKPVRRKLSISEYRKRYNMQASSCASGGAEGVRAAGGEGGSEDSSREASETGETGDAGDNMDPELRLQLHLEESLNSLSSGAHGVSLPGEKGKGLFDAQPTQLERQRENLSERLRREFGLSLPEDEEARSATALQESGHLPGIPLPDNIPLPAPCPAFLRPPPPTKLPRFDR